jgi:hypothetical protein
MKYIMNDTPNRYQKIALHIKYIVNDVYLSILSELCLKDISLLSYFCDLKYMFKDYSNNVVVNYSACFD